jgi:hypothetical protein
MFFGRIGLLSGERQLTLRCINTSNQSTCPVSRPAHQATSTHAAVTAVMRAVSTGEMQLMLPCMSHTACLVCVFASMTISTGVAHCQEEWVSIGTFAKLSGDCNASMSTTTTESPHAMRVQVPRNVPQVLYAGTKTTPHLCVNRCQVCTPAGQHYARYRTCWHARVLCHCAVGVPAEQYMFCRQVWVQIPPSAAWQPVNVMCMSCQMHAHSCHPGGVAMHMCLCFYCQWCIG